MWMMHEKVNEVSRLEREREIGRLLAARRARRELRSARAATRRMEPDARSVEAAAPLVGAGARKAGAVASRAGAVTRRVKAVARGAGAVARGAGAVALRAVALRAVALRAVALRAVALRAASSRAADEARHADDVPRLEKHAPGSAPARNRSRTAGQKRGMRNAGTHDALARSRPAQDHDDDCAPGREEAGAAHP